MSEDFEKMMYWAFGGLDFESNIIQAKIAWESLHPSLPSLKTAQKNKTIKNIQLLIYQVTIHWNDLNKSIKEDKPGLFRMIRIAFNDLVGKGRNG